MQKVILSLLLLLLSPSLCCAAYIIHLKNGSRFETNSYWKDGQSVRFTYKGGELGLDRALISSIEFTEEKIKPETSKPREILPEKQPEKKKKEEMPSEKKQKKAKKDSKKINVLNQRFQYLEEQFQKIKSMSDNETISLVNKLVNFRDVVIRERLAEDFEEEFLKVYSMMAAIESELNNRQ